jgi:hypothetical protein
VLHDEPSVDDYLRVVADRREGDPDLTTGAALFDAYDVVDPASVYGADDLAVAYRRVLARLGRAPSRSELVQLVALLASEGHVVPSPLQEFWIALAERGALA